MKSVATAPTPSMGGAYLAFGPGQISKFWRLWERPVQRVAFAGEHTDTLYPGTLEGALRTGQRAASQVEDLAAGKSFEPAKVAPAADCSWQPARWQRRRATSSATCSAARMTRRSRNRSRHLSQLHRQLRHRTPRHRRLHLLRSKHRSLRHR